MPGYADRFKTIQFPDLGDDLWITIRNPKTLPPSSMRPGQIATDMNGNPLDNEQAEAQMYGVLATLVKDWHVYDATSEEEDQPVLDLPATAESIAKLPLGIINRIAEELEAAINPK